MQETQRALRPEGPARPANGGPLRRPLVISVAGHVCLLVISLLVTVVGHGSAIWGEGGASGGAATVRLVSAASIPLPPPAVSTKNRVATENPGLHYPEPPQPAPKTAPPPKPAQPEKAVELPARKAKGVAKADDQEKQVVPEKPAVPPAKQAEAKPTPAPKAPPRQVAQTRQPQPPLVRGNEIPFGQGGPVQGPSGMFETEAGTGGLSISGNGGGDFDSRYGWYVRAIRNRISSNWLKGTVDPGILSAPRVYISFQILRDGRVVNTQLTASSGVASLDRSALRAIYDSSPMPALPGDYPGPSVAVEFWFDFQR